MKLASKPMKEEQIREYLHKLQLPEIGQVADLATLSRLQDAHLKFIPYENFDCLNSRLTSLKREDMFRKLIEHNRGGVSSSLTVCIIGCWKALALM